MVSQNNLLKWSGKGIFLFVRGFSMKAAHVCLAGPLSKNFSRFSGTGRKSELEMKVSLYVKIGLVLMAFMLVPLSAGAFPANKVAHGQPAQQVNASIHGKIVETMDSGGYTYVLLDTGSEKLWVATPKMKVSVGQVVDLSQGIEMAGFTSNTLKRTFDRIIFSSGKAVTPAAGMAKVGMKKKCTPGTCPMPSDKETMKMPHGGAPSLEKAAVVAVEKASGANAFTIGELYARKDKLDAKKVRVRGKVVKVSPNIMKRNWIHLQDGTGDAAKGTYDLTITSENAPKVGAVLVAEGILHQNKDFGAGYRYEVILEDATFK